MEGLLQKVRCALSGGGLEMFAGTVDGLAARYGEQYASDAGLILDRLSAFAALHGHSLTGALDFYGRYVSEVIDQRRRFLESGVYGNVSPAAEPGAAEGMAPGVAYLYLLTLSTVLNRSRYEIFRHFRQVVPGALGRGGRILEIGGGNCLDALFTSAYGRVVSYELNPASAEWHRLLGLGGRVELRIEQYTFRDEARFDFVSMVELLEHLPAPAEYLRGAHFALRDGGSAYFTFAVRMPQVDHLCQLDSVDECRAMVEAAGFSLQEEFCAIDTLYQFDEVERWELVEDPRHALIYACLVKKGAAAGLSFLDDIELRHS